MSSICRPLHEVEVINHHISAHGIIPNGDATGKALTIYRDVFTSTATASAIEKHLRGVGVVIPQWRYTMYSASHFHSTTHEVLVVTDGVAELCFGHEDNPNGVIEKVSRGDAIIIPAGVAHRLLRDESGTFSMIGSYPKGKNWDMCYGRPGEDDHFDQIRSLEWFERDPIYGEEGAPETAERSKNTATELSFQKQ